jgi:hypothetical protein
MLAGIVFISLGLLALVGFAWNIRRGAAGYTEDIRAYCKRIGNPYADDARGLRTLAIAKLAGTVGLAVVMLIGGALLIALAMRS